MSSMAIPNTCEFRNHHMGQFFGLDLWRKEFEGYRKLMSSSGREKMDDYIAKVKVFISYGYFDKEMNFQSKGKVANEVQSTDKILTTELLFSGLLNKLTNEEIIALFSILVFNVKGSNKAEPCTEKISEGFNEAVNFLVTACDQLIDIEKKFGVIDTEIDRDKRLNFFFYELMYGWAAKRPFLEVVQESPGLDEGSIVKMVNTVERMCQHVKAAARVMSDSKLAQRMEEASLLIKRDIIFTPSLYLE
jgi:antiviral helicase SKI2